MRTLLSPSLHEGFATLDAQREIFFPILERAAATAVWRRPTDADWAVGDTLLHLCKTMQVYRLLIIVSWPVLFPIACLFRNRPFERSTADIFAEYQAAGKRMRATRVLVPRRADQLPSAQRLCEQLKAETSRMRDTLAGMTDGLAGHFRIFDPGVGSPNLIQRVQLLGFHERHHFKIMEGLLEAISRY